MADERITVVGFDELARGSEQLVDKIGDKAGEAFDHEAQARADQASAAMPQVSGLMSGSVTTVYEAAAKRASVGILKSDVPYAGFVEFGGIRNRPYIPEGRYLFPIALAAEPELQATGERAATDEIKGASWPTPRT